MAVSGLASSCQCFSGNAELFSLEPAILELASHAALLLKATQLEICSSSELKPLSVVLVS